MDNGQQRWARGLARLDKSYTPLNNGFGLKHTTYFIHGSPVGHDHSHVQIEVCIARERQIKFHSDGMWDI